MIKPPISITSFLFLFLLFGCNDVADNAAPNTSPSLQQIHIVASPVSTRGSSSLILARGNTQPFIATGHYDDGSVKNLTSETSWHSSDSRIATISSPGTLTAIDAGTTTVTASHDGIISNTVHVTVADSTLAAIQVTPPIVSLAKGQTQQLTAIATYSDNTTADISSSLVWLTDDTATATVTTTGLLTGVEQGTTDVTASLDDMVSNAVSVTITDTVLTAIEITPPSVLLAKGQTRQLTAIATYSDNTTADISNSVAWLSDDTATATVTTTGLLTGVEQGSAEVTASLNGVTGNTADVTITDAVLTAIEITPPSVSLAKGQTRQLTAIATYSDNTTADISNSVAWLSDDTATATVTTTGLLTGVEQGSAEVTASLNGVTSNTADVTITDAILIDIQVTPASVSVSKGQTQQLTAIATYSDSTMADINNNVAWILTDTNTATVTSEGLLTGIEPGMTEVSATQDRITSNSVAIIVAPKFIDVSSNEFTFAVNDGFPSTGFRGAEFSLNTPAVSNYTWSSNAPWVSVDNRGTVNFTSQGNSSPVTITAMPMSGGVPLTYTFTVSKWFYNYSHDSTTGYKWAQAAELCSKDGWTLPTRADLTSGWMERGIGSLWSEWGNNWKSMYWTSEAVDNDHHYRVNMVSGSTTESSNNNYLAVACLQGS